MSWITVIGFIAALLTTFGFFPQVIKTCRMKETRDISLWMYIILAVGIVLWFIYGILINDYPVSIANGVTLILVSIILGAKIKYK